MGCKKSTQIEESPQILQKLMSITMCLRCAISLFKLVVHDAIFLATRNAKKEKSIVSCRRYVLLCNQGLRLAMFQNIHEIVAKSRTELHS